jgi:hypothetical protein
MPGSVRDYAILWVGATTGSGGGTALGGNALLRTPQHKLDGIEHLAADDTTRLDASVDGHGLAPKLSGLVTDVWRGDGTFGPGVSALDDLTDVNATAPTEGQVIRWSDADSAWIKADLPNPVVELDGTVVVEADGTLIWEW